MPGPNLGALGMAFTVMRGMQAVSLIAIIGMTANYISEMVDADTVPPKILIGTLSVTCIAVLYCAITWILYFDSVLPFLVSTASDAALLIAVIVVACLIGKPLSYLNCAKLSTTGGNTNAFVDSVGSNVGAVNYYVWAGASSTTCYEMKSIWGLSIALCVLFAFSGIVTVCLWRRQKAQLLPPKTMGA
ncbi:MAG: hypothetical protein M1818_003860 [Claussenomyces sp. TS43310]|nr:MAG: hypothetical protein M1818_003860 [Claussenomyces sp. TS43310]